MMAHGEVSSNSSSTENLLEFLVRSSHQVESLLNYHGTLYNEEEDFHNRQQDLCDTFSQLYDCNQAVQFLTNKLPQQPQTMLTSRLDHHKPVLEQCSIDNQQNQEQVYEYGYTQLPRPVPMQQFSHLGYNIFHQNDYIPSASTNSTQYSAKIEPQPPPSLQHPQVTGFTGINESPSHQQTSQVIYEQPQAAFVPQPATFQSPGFNCAYCYYLAATATTSSPVTLDFVNFIDGQQPQQQQFQHDARQVLPDREEN